MASETDDVRLRDAQERINVSLRQSAILQSIVVSSCFAMGETGDTSAKHTTIDMLDSFSTALSGLRDGHEWLGLLPEQHPDLQAALTELNGAWQRYEPAVLQILHHDYHAIVMRQILRDIIPLSDQVAQLSDQMIARYGADVFDDAFTNGLKFASHHRMLSQRLIKEMCFVTYNLGGDDMRARLRRSMEEFDDGFAVLSDGNADVPAAPNARIKRNLRTAGVIWKKQREVIEQVLDGNRLEARDLRKFLKFNATVLKQLNQAVEGYLIKA